MENLTEKTYLGLSHQEEKALALILHLGTPFCVCNGSILTVWEKDAREAYEKAKAQYDNDTFTWPNRLPFDEFETWAEQEYDFVNTGMDDIEAEGFQVVAEHSGEFRNGNIVNKIKVNHTNYFIYDISKPEPKLTPISLTPVGEDDWSRTLYKGSNGTMYVDVDGRPHTMTSDGEPIGPIYLPYKIVK